MNSHFAYEAQVVQNAICEEAAQVRAALTAPHILLKPSIFPDGTMWCVLLGEDLQTGISGFGPTPAQAAREFDKAWNKQGTPKAMFALNEIAEEEAKEEKWASSQFGMGA